MTEKHIFADVSLPFHVWVKEGPRWVLRDAASRFGDEASAPAIPPTSPHPGKDHRPSRH